MDLGKYLSDGIEKLIKDIIKATFKNPTESLFMTRFARSVKSANKIREEAKKNGEHIPAFLIASITSSCNLHCAGCYARANASCSDSSPCGQLSSDEWKRVFDEARELGIRFILLAGGEPMIRKDVIKVVASIDDVMFPIFTNGTMIDDEYMNLLDKHRNIVPLISIEGNESITDSRRGSGVYENVINSMKKMSDKGIIFGASITVTKSNLSEVTSDSFISFLKDKGCKAMIFVEYVPISDNTKELAPNDEDRNKLMTRLSELRQGDKEMIFVAFPGDEKSSGGCLAAGRGFFHINSHGGAEPCPFATYSDINVRDTSVKEALKSRLFYELQKGDILKDDHEGGCVLFEKKEEVERIIKSL